MAYSQKEKDKILNKIFNSIVNGKSLRRCLNDANLAYDTFFRWIDADETKSKQYARATELRAEAMAEELLSISDHTEHDVIIGDDGKEITNHNIIQRDKLRVDTRKWLMSKMQPKKYSDNGRLQLEGGENPIKTITQIERVIIDPKTDD